jgi:inner membrane transporter RhtA
MHHHSVARGFSAVAGRVPAPGLVLAGVCGIQFGAALAPRAYPQAGAAGVVFLRLLIAGVLLCLLWRPRRQALSGVKGAWGTVLAAGTLLAGHHIASSRPSTTSLSGSSPPSSSSALLPSPWQAPDV